jgi:hypothetical protein
MKWRVVAGALVTLPLAFWYLGSHPKANANFVVAVAFIPVWIGLFIEISDRWRQVGDAPDKFREGSPVGNVIAWVLAVPLALLLVYVVYCLITAAP